MQEELLNLLLPHQLPDLTPPDIEIITQSLSHPAVRKYLQHIFHTSVTEFIKNEIETEEQMRKAALRFNKLKGIQYLCVFLLNNFQGKKVEAKPEEKK